MDSKTLFLADKMMFDGKTLSEWWAAISNDPRFDRVLMVASACAMEQIPSADQRSGVLAFKDILLNLSNAEAAPVSFSSPGLHHNLDVKRRTIERIEKSAGKPTEPAKKV